MTRIKEKDIPTVLRLIADAIEHGQTEATFAMVEEWYNCDSIEGRAKFTVVYGPKKRALGERQC